MNSELSMDNALLEKLTKILEVNLEKEDFGVKELERKQVAVRNCIENYNYRKIYKQIY